MLKAIMHSLSLVHYSLIIYFYVCLSLSHCLSVFTIPALPTDTIMASSTRTEGLPFTRGRTQASRNVIYEGFRYGTPKETRGGIR